MSTEAADALVPVYSPSIFSLLPSTFLFILLTDRLFGLVIRSLPRKWETRESNHGSLPIIGAFVDSTTDAYCDRLVGLVVKASASVAEDPVFESRLRGDFSGSSHTSDFKIGTPVAILPGAWHYRVSAGTGRPGVSILSLGEVESWICNFCLTVAARKIV